MSLTLYGMYDLVGKTVSAFIAGLDCGDYVVAADGSITVLYQSDADGLLTQAYLINVATNLTFGVLLYGWGVSAVKLNLGGTNYTVPVAVGCTYTSQGQTLRPDVQHPGQNGMGLGKTRRLHMFSAYVITGVQVSFGSDFSTTLVNSTFPGNGGAAINKATLFTGVYWDTLNCNYDFEGRLCWQVSRPWPCTIGSVTSFLQCQDR